MSTSLGAKEHGCAASKLSRKPPLAVFDGEKTYFVFHSDIQF